MDKLKDTFASYSPELKQAAFDAADGNDGVNWGLLHDKCPVNMSVGDFIDLLVMPTGQII